VPSQLLAWDSMVFGLRFSLFLLSRPLGLERLCFYEKRGTLAQADTD
jgi:hypothetical protein